jgi:hypothetical protein
MPKVTYLQTNFTAGELSPRVHGRVDIAKYQNGVEEMRDAIVEVYGGAKRRPSSLFVASTKDSAAQSRLVPFVRNSDTAYMLEFGNLYVRVFTDQALVGPGAPAAYNGATAYVPGNLVSSGGVNYYCKANTTGNAPPNATYWYPMPAGVFEFPSPYTTAQVQEMDFTQGADTMFLFHQAVAPYKLVCAGNTSWTFSAVVFTSSPFVEDGTYPAATLTPSTSGPVGEPIHLMTGDATGTTTALTAAGWGSGAAIYTTGAAHGLASNDAIEISGTVATGYNRTGIITVLSATQFQITVRQNPGDVTTNGRYTPLVPVAVFSAGDVGKVVRINGGLVEITGFLNSGVVGGIVRQELDNAFPSPQDAWSLHEAAWTVTNGYPRTGTLHEQRLVCAGSPAYPQTMWGSTTGAYLDFQQGTADDEPFSFTIASDVVNPIKYLASNRGVLLAFTTGGEFTVQGGTEKPLTPTNAQIKLRRNFGCAEVRPVRLRDAQLFIQRAGRKILSFGYLLSNDDWAAPDVSVLSEHLTEGGIAGMCWQQEPDSIIWAFRADGALLSISYDKEQDVTAWEYHEGFGRDGTVFVESIGTIPAATGDEVWMIVRRTIDAATVRYVERLTLDSAMDCGVVSSGAAATVWTGLDHLEGETVGAVGDGRYLGEYTVASGQITVSRSSAAKNAGLVYTPRVKLLPPEIQTGMGSASGNAMRTSEVTVRFYRTTGCKINGKAMSFRNLGAGVLDAAPEEFTGVKRLENLGFDRGESALEFTQDEPMPFHILSVTRKFTTNDG